MWGKVKAFTQNYNRAIFRFVASGRSAPSERRLRAFEQEIDFRFPDEFRELSTSPLSGLCFEVCEELWAREAQDGEEPWLGLFDIRVFGIAYNVPKRLDLRQELNALPPIETDLIPFMARGRENYRYCFDLDHQIIRWSAEDGQRELVQLPLEDLLIYEFMGLEERWEQLKASRTSKKKKTKRRAKKTRVG